TCKKIGGIGAVLTGLRKPVVFGLCIVLPLAAFFVYELIIFIKTVVSVKNDGKKMISQADEELIKQRAIEEYIKKQQAESDSGEKSE
ncbi:MAG: signal peptidase I, partial [Clostridia bacterium]|nr:signal peptidase I [Clostridia bacterium]